MPEKSRAAAGRRPRSARRGASFRRRAGGTRVLGAGVGVNSRGLIHVACLHAPRPGNHIVMAPTVLWVRVPGMGRMVSGMGGTMMGGHGA